MLSAPTNDTKNSQKDGGVRVPAQRAALLSLRTGDKHSYSGNQYLLGKWERAAAPTPVGSHRQDSVPEGGSLEEERPAPTPGPAPVPAATFVGCSAARNRRLERDRVSAASLASRAATVLTHLTGGTATAGQQSAMTHHFGAINAAQMGTASGRFSTMATYLGDRTHFNCVPATDAWCSNCGGGPSCACTLCPTAAGPTRLCPAAFSGSCAEPSLTSIILHEAGRAAGCCAPDVQPGTGYPPAPPASLTNVYSYTGFARAI